MKDLFNFLIEEANLGHELTPETAVARLGLRGKILDMNAIETTPHISDETKSFLFVRDAITRALSCPLCEGYLDPNKSVSYDHIKPVREQGTGEPENVQLVHPYCNSSEMNK
jgi:hypothetical protein